MSSDIFHLSGLTCGACQKLIQKRISRINGVLDVQVDADGKTIIGSERQIKIDEVEKALEDTKYKIKSS